MQLLSVLLSCLVVMCCELFVFSELQIMYICMKVVFRLKYVYIKNMKKIVRNKCDILL